MRKKRRWWVVIVVVVLLGGVGYVGLSAWQQVSAMREAAQAPAEETAVVRRGTLRATVSASGSLAPRDEVSLAFLSGGRVAGVPVEVGDVVQAGDVLARLDDADAREAVADAELQVAQAEINLALARIEAELGLTQADLDAAQAGYDEAVTLAARTGDQLTSARVSLEQAQDALADAQEDYYSAWDQARDWELNVKGRKDALEAEREATESALERAQYDLEVAQADYNLAVVGISESEVRNAWTKVLNAQVAVENEPLQGQQLELSLSQAQLKLDSARRALEETVLIAPMDGTVTVLNIQAGEMASAGQPTVVLSDLAVLEVDINLDETDVAQISVSQEALVSLDAFPDVELAGEIAYIAPVAQVESGVVLYPVTIRLAPTDPTASSGQALPVRVGMTADVEIVMARRENALIVPLRAIRSTEGGSFVLRQVTDGDVAGAPANVPRMSGQGGERAVESGFRQQLAAVGFEPVRVTLGLMTDTEVEISSGLSEGDVVSVVATSSQSLDTQMPGPMRMFGGRD